METIGTLEDRRVLVAMTRAEYEAAHLASRKASGTLRHMADQLDMMWPGEVAACPTCGAEVVVVQDRRIPAHARPGTSDACSGEGIALALAG